MSTSLTPDPALRSPSPPPSLLSVPPSPSPCPPPFPDPTSTPDPGGSRPSGHSQGLVVDIAPEWIVSSICRGQLVRRITHSAYEAPLTVKLGPRVRESEFKALQLVHTTRTLSCPEPLSFFSVALAHPYLTQNVNRAKLKLFGSPVNVIVMSTIKGTALGSLSNSQITPAQRRSVLIQVRHELDRLNYALALSRIGPPRPGSISNIDATCCLRLPYMVDDITSADLPQEDCFPSPSPPHHAPHTPTERPYMHTPQPTPPTHSDTDRSVQKTHVQGDDPKTDNRHPWPPIPIPLQHVYSVMSKLGPAPVDRQSVDHSATRDRILGDILGYRCRSDDNCNGSTHNVNVDQLAKQQPVRFCHMDLHAGNIMVQPVVHAELEHFGLENLSPNSSASSARRRPFCGPPAYRLTGLVDFGAAGWYTERMEVWSAMYHGWEAASVTVPRPTTECESYVLSVQSAWTCPPSQVIVDDELVRGAVEARQLLTPYVFSVRQRDRALKESGGGH